MLKVYSFRYYIGSKNANTFAEALEAIVNELNRLDKDGSFFEIIKIINDKSEFEPQTEAGTAIVLVKIKEKN